MNIEVHQFNPGYTPISQIVFKTNDSTIDQIDLKKIIIKLLSEKSLLGDDQEFIEEVALMYRAFLFLCKNYPNEVIVPTREVDEFWHLHILDTRAYQKDCQKIFGYYLHHYPYAGLPGTNQSDDQEEEFLAKTVGLISHHFPQLL